MKYYVFEPLMDGGEQVVRTPEYGEWYIDPYGNPNWQFLDAEERVGIIGADDPYPILTLRTYDEDPIRELREVYGELKDANNYERADNYKALWQAISAVVERWGGKK